MAQRGISLAQSLLRAQLGQRVNVMILEKALTLDLTQFEDSEFYDKLTRARREASSRPLSLVMRTFGLLQNAISLISFGGLLIRFSPWAVVLLVARGTAGVSRRGKILGRGVPPVSLAGAGIAHADLSRVRARARGQRQGGEAVRARREASRPLSGDLHAPVPGGSRSHHPARRLGLRTGPGRHGRPVRRLCVDRRRNRRRRHDRRANDHVPHAAAPGSSRRERGARRHQRPVRRQSVSVESVRIPGAARAGLDRHAHDRPAPRATASASRTWSSCIRTPPRPRCRISICTCNPARAWPWLARTAPARPR